MSKTLSWNVKRWIKKKKCYKIYYIIAAPEENTEAVTESTTEEEEPADHQKVEVPVGGNVQLHCPKGNMNLYLPPLREFPDIYIYKFAIIVGR